MSDTGNADNPQLVRLRARTRMIWSGDELLLQLGRQNLRLSGFGEDRVAELHELRAGCVVSQVLHSDWMSALLDGGFLENAPLSSSDPDLARFDRLLSYLSEFEGSGNGDRFHLLDRLRGSHVLVVGLGGMASWVIYNLLCCAIGNFTLVDGDVVEPSNLNRSIMFTEDDIGVPKVLAVEKNMRRFAPRTVIHTKQLYVSRPDDLRELMHDVDLVVGIADTPPWAIREWVTAAAIRAGKPVIQASGARVGPFHTGPGSACSICDWTLQFDRHPNYGELLYRQSRLPKGNSGSLSPMGAIISGMIGLEILRFILGQAPRTRNQIWAIRNDLSVGFTDCPPNPQCDLCGAEDANRVPAPSKFLGL
jgi:hypothetical protein